MKKLINNMIDLMAGIQLVKDESPKIEDPQNLNIKYMPKTWHAWRKVWVKKFRDLDKIQDKMEEGGLKESIKYFLIWMMAKLAWLSIAVLTTPLTILIWMICQIGMTVRHEKKVEKATGKKSHFGVTVGLTLAFAIMWGIVLVKDYQSGGKISDTVNSACDQFAEDTRYKYSQTHEREVTEAYEEAVVTEVYHENEIIDDDGGIHNVDAEVIVDVDGDGVDDMDDEDTRICEE